MYDANQKVAQEIENLEKTSEVINTAVMFGNLPENTRAHLTSAHNAIGIAIRHLRGQRITIDSAMVVTHIVQMALQTIRKPVQL